MGRLTHPSTISPQLGASGQVAGAVNIAFRFGASQFYNLWACGDLKRNMVNLSTTIHTPITLPTW